MVRLVIPGALPSMNDIILLARGDKYASNKQKKEYTDMVAFLAKQAKLPRMNKVDVAIHWYESDKRRDKDNIMAGTKFIFDGLVMAGVLPNDGWKNIGNISHLFYVDRTNPRIEVELREVV